MHEIESLKKHRLAEGLRRVVILTVRLSGLEYAQLQSTAKERKTSLSALGRGMLLGKLPPPVVDREFAQQLGRLGNNLNQLAHNSNSWIDPDATALRAELQAMGTLLRDVQKGLRRDWQINEGQ